MRPLVGLVRLMLLTGVIITLWIIAPWVINPWMTILSRVVVILERITAVVIFLFAVPLVAANGLV
jgi:hypothetical protein